MAFPWDSTDELIRQINIPATTGSRSQLKIEMCLFVKRLATEEFGTPMLSSTCARENPRLVLGPRNVGSTRERGVLGSNRVSYLHFPHHSFSPATNFRDAYSTKITGDESTKIIA